MLKSIIFNPSIQAAAEEFAVAYENTYKMPIVVVHTMNVFGERQLPSKFIPKVLTSVLEGKEVSSNSQIFTILPMFPGHHSR